MATITNATLDIKKELGNAKIIVDYKLNFNSCEVDAHSSFEETCEIIGVDQPGGPNSNIVSMMNPPSQSVVAQSTPLLRHRTLTVNQAVLNEDPSLSGGGSLGGPGDEIQAVVRLKPDAIVKRSSVFSGTFV